MILWVIPFDFMKPEKIIIGSRGSKLALWQANFVASELKARGVEAPIVVIKTQGDRIQDLSFDKLEGKGFFTKEIEAALLAGDIDLAVHSMKDLPTTSPEGLSVAGVSDRANPQDLLIIRKDKVDASRKLNLPEKAIVGTSSNRRKAQINHFRPDAKVVDLRGNVPTRINKLKTEDYDAIILAAAGVERLEIDLSDVEIVPLNVKEFVPAPAQGVLAYQVRSEDIAIRKFIQTELHHTEVSSATNVERKLLKLLDGGCHLPLGAHCELDHLGHYHLWVSFANSLDQPLKMIRKSSSTSLNLAEEAYETLQTD